MRRAFMLLTLGLLLAGPLVLTQGDPAKPDKTAEDEFRKIEKTIMEAKTVRVTFHLTLAATKTGDGADRVVKEVSGTLLLKEGNKVNLVVQEGKANKPRQAISDGTKAKIGSKDNGDWREENLPKTLKSGFAMALARCSIVFWAMDILPMAGEDIHEDADLDKVLHVSDFKAGKDEKNVKTLTYKLIVHSPLKSAISEKDVWKAKLWYDSGTWTPLKHTLSQTRKEGQATIETTGTEAYDEWALNGDLPDEKFRLPADKEK